jgi:hypothetical protein
MADTELDKAVQAVVRYLVYFMAFTVLAVTFTVLTVIFFLVT